MENRDIRALIYEPTGVKFLKTTVFYLDKYSTPFPDGCNDVTSLNSSLRWRHEFRGRAETTGKKDICIQYVHIDLDVKSY